MSELRWQLDTEDLEQTSDLVLEIDALVEHGSATGEQHADMVALHADDIKVRRLQKLAISLKQPLERQVSGKAAAQAKCEERVRTCH